MSWPSTNEGRLISTDFAPHMVEVARGRDDGLALSVRGAPDKNPWVTCFGMVMTQRGYPPQGDPFGPGGMFSMAEPDKVRSMLSGAGFDDIEVEEIPCTRKFGSFEDVWAFSTEVAGAIAVLIKQLSPEEVENLRAAAIPAIEPYKTEEG